LDIVAEQDPAGGQRAERGSGVTVRYWNKTEMDNLVGKAGAAECNRIMTSTNNLVSCELLQGVEAPSPAQSGTITQQSVAAGAEIKIHDRVMLTIYQKQVPRVPTIPKGTPPDTGCQIVTQRGYHCVQVADALDPIAGVISQNPPGETPQEAGDVVLHYSPHEARPLHRYRKIGSPDVHIIRFAGEAVNGYQHDEQLGRAYPPNTGLTGGTALTVRDFMCTASASACGGVAPNHYYTLDTDTDKPNWALLRVVGFTLKPVNGQCGAGQVMINRYMARSGSQVEYIVDHSGQAPPGTVFTENLGCVWQG
jgi:hypothetical protein